MTATGNGDDRPSSSTSPPLPPARRHGIGGTFDHDSPATPLPHDPPPITNFFHHLNSNDNVNCQINVENIFASMTEDDEADAPNGGDASAYNISGNDVYCRNFASSGNDDNCSALFVRRDDNRRKTMTTVASGSNVRLHHLLRRRRPSSRPASYRSENTAISPTT